ncbi:MAG: RNA-binding domain-containing protein [Candidatus Riflebacteria bacterium]
MTESNRIENKQELTDNLEKEVIGFLNSHDGGKIQIGIDKTGKVKGVSDPDSVQLKIKDRLKNNIKPSIMGLFDIVLEKNDEELMRVFRDLEIVEQLGSGVPRIVEKYGRKVFEIKPNFIRVILPYAEHDNMSPQKTVEKTVEETSVKTVEKIIQAMKDEPGITIEKLAQITGLTTRGVEWNLTKLKEIGKVKRVGPKKGGHWEVMEP